MILFASNLRLSKKKHAEMYENGDTKLFGASKKLQLKSTNLIRTQFCLFAVALWVGVVVAVVGLLPLGFVVLVVFLLVFVRVVLLVFLPLLALQSIYLLLVVY